VFLSGFFFVAQAQLIAPPHHTLQSLTTCDGNHFYASQSARSPSRIAKSFEGKGALVAFRTCTDADGNTHYFVLEPRPNRNGVCRTYEHELFPGGDQDEAFITLLYDGTAPDWYFMMKGWKSWPPADWNALHYSARSEVFAFVSGEKCPLGSDPRYLPVEHITDGTLKAFESLWLRINSSPKDFTEVFAHVTIPANQGDVIERFRHAVFDDREQITSISCGDGGCTAYFGDFAVRFDTSISGIEIEGVEQLPET
jgi:hypothetical protein